MVFAGGWYVWRNNPLRALFFWVQNTLWCSRAVVIVWHHNPLRPFFGAQNTLWCSRGGWYVWRNTPYGPFLGHKHACMVFAGGCDVGHNTPLTGPFWGTKHACMVFAGGVVCLAHHPLRALFLGHKTCMYGVRGVGMFGTTTLTGPFFGAQITHVWCLRGCYVWRHTPYGPFLGHRTRIPNPVGPSLVLGRRSSTDREKRGFPLRSAEAYFVSHCSPGHHLYREALPELAFDPSRRVCSPFRPAVCRGPHLYRQERPEVAFDPSRRVAGVPSRILPGPHLYPKGRPELALDPSRRGCSTLRPESCRGPHLYQKGRPGTRL